MRAPTPEQGLYLALSVIAAFILWGIVVLVTGRG